MSENIQLYGIFTQPIILIMLLSINKKSHKTIFEQLFTQITGLIENGTLNTGFRMPSTRELAGRLEVNRTTIVHVYDELWAQGYIESSPGSYTIVRKRKPIIKTGKTDENSQDKKKNIYSDNLDVDYDTMEKYVERKDKFEGDTINFLNLAPDTRLLDKKLIAGCMRKVLTDSKANPFDYTHSRGYPPLRQEIVKHMKLHSIHAEDKNILITNGSQQSLQLIFQVFSGPGDCIAVEMPSYSLLYPVLKIFRLKVIGIPMLPDGMDTEALKKIFSENKVRFLYTMPTFQNPTGISMPQNKREEILHLCEKGNCIIIEDSIEEELKYFGKAYLPIKSMDYENQVIYLGTFAKVLAPGLRTGWIIAAPECIKKLTAVKTIFDIASSSINQIFLYKFCSTGAYEIHLRKMMREFRKRMKTAVGSIKKYIPAEKIQWTEPTGGYLIWLKLLSGHIGNIEKYFLSYGVRVQNGMSYFISPQADNFIRISISQANEKEIEEGMIRLGKAISGLGQ
jgi:DNA-binding transcriptional MocR family regulator